MRTTQTAGKPLDHKTAMSLDLEPRGRDTFIRVNPAAPVSRRFPFVRHRA